MQKLNGKLLTLILKEIRDNPKVTEEYIAKKTFYSERTIRRYFKILKDKGIIIFTNPGKNRCWKIR